MEFQPSTRLTPGHIYEVSFQLAKLFEVPKALGQFEYSFQVIPLNFEMAVENVKPYVKTNKNDQADAEAICEAVARPNMRFVPIKSVEQQDILSIHRIRARLVRNRTALANEIRGLLYEFGLIIPQGINKVISKLDLPKNA